MLYEWISLIIELCSTVLVAACLLRFYLHFLKVNFAPNSGNPFSYFLIPLTNWLIAPIKRILPLGAQIEISSLLASYLLVFAKTAALLALSNTNPSIGQVLVMSLFSLMDLALSGLIGLLIVYSFFSWTQTYSPTQILFYEMVEPLLKPIRKFSPKISGIDVSSLILLILIQMLSISLHHAQKWILNLL
jgi:YggT family protein